LLGGGAGQSVHAFGGRVDSATAAGRCDCLRPAGAIPLDPAAVPALLHWILLCALSKGMTTTMPEGYQLDARNTVLDADDVHARYHWARTVGYQRTGQYAKTGTSWRGMPLPIGKVWRLNLLMACEDRAAAGTMPAAPVAAIPALGRAAQIDPGGAGRGRGPQGRPTHSEVLRGKGRGGRQGLRAGDDDDQAAAAPGANGEEEAGCLRSGRQGAQHRSAR